MYSVTHSKSPFIHLTVTSNSTFPWVSLPSPETWFLLELHSSVNMASPFSFQNSNLERYWKTDTFQIQRTPAVVNVTWIHGPFPLPLHKSRPLSFLDYHSRLLNCLSSPDLSPHSLSFPKFTLHPTVRVLSQNYWS